MTRTDIENRRIEIRNKIEHAKNDLKGLASRVARAFKSCQSAGILNSQDCFDLGAAVGMINRLETAAYKVSEDQLDWVRISKEAEEEE